MTSGDEVASVRANCCAAGDLQAVSCGASSKVPKPPVVLIAPIVLTAPPLTSTVDASLHDPRTLSNPTYLIVSSFRI